MANSRSIDVDIKAATRDLTRIQREQIPFAMSVGINNLARRAQTEGLRVGIERAFNRPTRYTLGGTFVARGNKRNPTATVGLIDKPKGANRAPVKYLSAQLAGGQRRMAGYEVALRAIGALPDGWRAVPAAGIKLDSYGNMSRKELRELIGSLKTGIRVAAGRGKRSYLRGYFVARPGQRRTAHFDPGVWRRTERGDDSAVQPVLLFVQNATYRARLDVVGLITPIVNRYARAELDSALKYALNTAR